MTWLTQDLLDAVDFDEHEVRGEEIQKRLYHFRELVGAVDNLVSALHHSREITIEPSVLFALTDIFNVREKIDVDQG